MVRYRDRRYGRRYIRKHRHHTNYRKDNTGKKIIIILLIFGAIYLIFFSDKVDISNLSLNSSKENKSFLEKIDTLTSGGEKNIGEIEAKILVLVNEERSRNGAGALSSSSNLDNFARDWSNKMISQDFFEHSNLDFQYSSIAGENIGETPIHYDVIGCGSTYSEENMAECFVTGWIGSSGHHENMIDKRFSMTGIGVSCDSSKCRATQVFGG